MAKRERARGRIWPAIRLIGVLSTAVLIAGLIRQPELSLTVLWKVVIPLVPVSLLVSPLLWRNACPLATLEMAVGRLRTGRPVWESCSSPSWSPLVTSSSTPTDRSSH